MQYIVMWLVLQGVGLADTVWLSLVQGNALQTATINSAIPNITGVNKLANNIFISSICTVTGQKIERDLEYINSTWKYQTDGNNIIFGKDAVGRKDRCGLIKLLDTNSVSNDNPYRGRDIFANISNINKSTVSKEVLIAHNVATQEMVAELYSIANNFVVTENINGQKKISVNNSALPENMINTISDKYIKKIDGTVQNMKNQLLANGHSAIIQQSGSEGWILAGAWFMKIANQMSQLKAQVGTIPESNSPSIRNTQFTENLGQINQGIGALSPSNHIIAGVSNYFVKRDHEFNQIILMAHNALSNNNSNLRISSDGDEGWMGRLTANIAWIFTNVDIWELSSDNSNIHPIIQVKEMGDRMIFSAITAIGVIVAATAGISGLVGVVSTSAAVSGAVMAAPFAFTIFGGLLAMGWFLAYYIPMMPFLIWIGALIGWFIMVIEAIIAAPLWAVMHLHPNGDDVTGRGGQGYMLVLGLLVRPTLMIFGLAAAIILSMVFGDFLNAMFSDVFKMSRNGSDVGVWATIFGTVIYVSMMVTFVKKMFDMIHIIPDQLLQWIGGGGPQLGGYAGAMVQGSENDFMKGGAAVGAIASRGVGDGIGTAQRGLTNERMRKQQEQDKKLSDQGRVHDKQIANDSNLAKMGFSEQEVANNLGLSEEDRNSSSGQEAISAVSNALNKTMNQAGNYGATAQHKAQAGAAFMSALSNSSGSLSDRLQSAQKAANNSFLGNIGHSKEMSSLIGSIADTNTESQLKGIDKANQLKASTTPQEYDSAVNSAISTNNQIGSGINNAMENGDVSAISSPEGVNDFVNNALATGGIQGPQATEIQGYGSVVTASNSLSQAASAYQNSPTESNRVALRTAGHELQQRLTNSIFHHATQNSIKRQNDNNENPGSGGHSVSGSSQTTVSEVKESAPVQSGGSSRINPSETDSN